VEVKGSDKHFSLLQYGNNYCRKKFYRTGPSSAYILALCQSPFYREIKISVLPLFSGQASRRKLPQVRHGGQRPSGGTA